MPQAAARDAIYRRRRFTSDVIVRCVRWYITYRLSYRDIAAMMAETGVVVTHTTIMRWVFRYVPEYERRWARLARPVGSSWRMDETAISIRGKQHYVYRCVDKTGKSVNSMLSPIRSIQAAQVFFRQAVIAAGAGWPNSINLDKYPASHQALRLLRQEDERWRCVLVRDRRYLNNVVEQDHRAIKGRCSPMLGFKSVTSAAVTIAGIELAHRIRKKQFYVGSGDSNMPANGLTLLQQWAQALKASVPEAGREAAADPLLHQISFPSAMQELRTVPEVPRRYPRKVFVGGGLYMLHQPNGSRYWRLKYRFGGRERTLALGVYPYVSAELARARHLVARRFLEQGIDPGGRRTEVRRGSHEPVSFPVVEGGFVPIGGLDTPKHYIGER